MDYSDNQESENTFSDLYQDPKAKQHILENYVDKKNICDSLDEEQLAKCAMLVLHGVSEDESSQTKWMADTDDALKLSRLTKEPKNTPWDNASNIKYPLITTACYQFAARTYPELIQDGKIVKAQIEGRSNPMLDMMSEGISTHMSYQLLGADSEWEESMDTLLVVLPNVGFLCKKTYYDSLKKKNISDVIHYKDLILRNDASIQCLDDLRRITQVLHMHPNDLISGCRSGLYYEDAIEEIMNYYTSPQANPACDLYEQHRFLDLDDDGYEEPYIVTVHKQTTKVIRIVARFEKSGIEFNEDKEVVRIAPTQYFTAYKFLPAPDGSFMSVGFGSLMLHLNETVNTILNQLIDAGTLANLKTGIIDSRVKIMGGQMRADPGQWTRVKGVNGTALKDGFMPLDYKEPSTVLYQLLGLLLQASKELTSSTDAMQGMQNATNVPATSMLAMIEQGLKMFSAIQRRLYRSLKQEYQKLYILNGKHLDEQEYITVLGDDFKQLPNIYQTKAIKVIPVADPNLSSDAQRMAQAQALMVLAGKPGINNAEIYTRYLESIKAPNPKSIVSPDPKASTPPDPKAMEMQAKAQTKSDEVKIKARAQELKEKEFAAKLSKIEAEITQMQSAALKNVAQSKQIEHSTGLDEFHAKLQAIKDQVNAVAQAHSQMSDQANQSAQLRLKQQELNQNHAENMTSLQQSQDQIDNDQSNAGQDNQTNANGVDSSPDNSGNA